MEKDKHIKKELEDIAPLLSKMKKEEGYKVPFNYFEKMEDDIMSNLFPKEEVVGSPLQPSWWDNTIQLIRLLFQPRYALAFASIVVLIVAGLTIFGPESVTDCNNEPVACITLEELENYIDTNIDDFDVDLLAESQFNEFSDPDLLHIDMESLDEYIDENILENIDLNTLEELL